MMGVKPARIFKHLRVNIPGRGNRRTHGCSTWKRLVKEFFAALERDKR